MRTKKTFLTFVTSFFPWLLIAIIGFIKIKLFITYFGEELNGLIQFTHQTFMFLTLISMGFNSAIMFSLYKPLADKDRKKISSLVKGSQKIFTKIGLIIFVLGLILSCVIPFIIYNLQISKIYVFLIFFLYAIDYLSSYIMLSTNRILLEADQKGYKVNIVLNLKLIIFRLIELVLIVNTVNIVIIIISSIVANILANLVIIKIIKKDYHWLDNNAIPDYSSKKITKDVFVHKINNFIFYNTDIILLTVTKGLTTVSLYGAYNYIVQYFKQLITFVFRSPQASLGNLFVGSNDLDEKYKVFKEYIFLSFYLALMIVPIFIVSVSSFVGLWINESFILSHIVIILFGLIIWHEILIIPLITVVESNGMFKETKKIPIIASIINILLSLLLIYKFGILGLLLASIVSYIFITQFLYIRYIYEKIFKRNFLLYYRKYIIIIGLLIFITLSHYFFINVFEIYNNINIIDWFIRTSLMFLFQTLVLSVLFYCTSPIFKKLIKRIFIIFNRNSEVKNAKKN